MKLIDPAVHVLVAADVDEHGGGGLASGDHGRVVKQPHIVGVARAGDERHRVPGNGRELGVVETDCAVACIEVSFDSYKDRIVA